MQFAYGRVTENERIRERAMDLLESIAAEDNRYMRRWAAYGAEPQSAFESQALLQLSTAYCDPKRCEECPAGRRILRSDVTDADAAATVAESMGMRSW